MNQCYVADVMVKVALSADVTGLATVVTVLCVGFKSLGMVDVHRDARRECADTPQAPYPHVD
jgi:hypothetical protein